MRASMTTLQSMARPASAVAWPAVLIVYVAALLQGMTLVSFPALCRTHGRREANRRTRHALPHGGDLGIAGPSAREAIGQEQNAGRGIGRLRFCISQWPDLKNGSHVGGSF